MIAIDSSVTKIGHNLNTINWLAITIGSHVMFNRSLSVYNLIFVVLSEGRINIIPVIWM